MDGAFIKERGKMKADKIFDTVIGLMFSDQKDKSNYESMFCPILNLITAECFTVNNILRRRNELEPLTEIPFAEDLEDDIPYEDEMLRKIMPYGIAAQLYSEDDENGITNVYREKYMQMLLEIGYAEFMEAEE